MRNAWMIGLAGCLALGSLAGCSVPEIGAAAPAAPTVTPEPPRAVAGLAPVSAESGGPLDVKNVAASRNFAVRGADPFALLPAEQAYENQQQAERFLLGQGGWSNLWEEPEDLFEPAPITVPLPNWRLAGIIIGDGVAALLDMGNGQVVDIRPGSRVPGTDWVVVSINTERALLRRTGPFLPKEFEVGLKGPVSGQATGGLPFGGGGGTPFGPPGGPAGRFGGPGGPGGVPGLGPAMGGRGGREDF